MPLRYPSATIPAVPGLRLATSDNRAIVWAGGPDLGGGALADATPSGRSSLVRVYLPYACSNLVLTYENYSKNTYYESPNTADLIVKAAVWTDSAGANRYPVTFGGQRSIAILGNQAAGQRVDSDNVGIYLPAGYAWVATFAKGSTSGQKVTITGGVTGGTWTYTALGQTTGTIAWNASAATVQTAVAALGSVGAGNVTVSGTGPWTIQFQNGLAASPPPLGTASAAGLTGGTPAIAVACTGQIPIGCFIYGSSGSTSEGTTVGSDITDSGSVTLADGQCYAPTMIRGQVGTAPAKTFAFWGDSIARGTGDTYSDRGFLSRGLGYSGPASTPLYPFVRLACGGEKTTDQQGIRRYLRMRRSLHASHCFLNTAINDVTAGTALATIQANILEIASAVSQSGARVVVTTLPPNTTSTDKFATATNQAVGTFEAARTGLNDWYRDGAPVNSSGVAVAVGTTAAGTLRAGAVGHPIADYVEVADTVEANSSNALTRNGGRWQVATTFAVSDSGTATSGSTTTLVDTTKSWTVNAFAGLRVWINSGTGSGTGRSIQSNTATTLTVQASWTAPDATSVYQIDNPPTQDGTHPMTATHILMAPAISAKAAALPS